ncbi:hypothetical protein SNE40_000543 [Patella caerulea]|uniref:Farnesoic acid O-methyl transferase domain-containing protein n=1 Tax=Patella caerulea TaxID=87958 RepID=A0AAN8QA42_PATCE
MDVAEGVRILLLAYLVHLSTNDIISLPKRSEYTGEFYNVVNQESKIVYLKTSKGAMVGFFESVNVSSLVYEVKVGKDMNTQTVIRNSKSGPTMNSTTDPNLLLDNTRFKPFYFIWSHNTLVIGAGTVVGHGSTLQWSNDKDVTVRYISVRAGSSPLDYIFELSCKKF